MTMLSTWTCAPTPQSCDFGRYGHCDQALLPIFAPSEGTYKFTWNWLGSMIVRNEPFEEGEQLRIYGVWFNENSKNRIQVYDPDGVQLIYTVTPEVGDPYGCYDFEITFTPSFYATQNCDEDCLQINPVGILSLSIVTGRKMQIFNATGQTVFTVTEFQLPSDTGLIDIEWNGRDDYEQGLADDEFYWTVNTIVNTITFNVPMGAPGVGNNIWIAVKVLEKERLRDLI